MGFQENLQQQKIRNFLQKFPQQVSSLARQKQPNKLGLLFRPHFFDPSFSSLKNRLPEICCMWPEFGLSLLPNMALVRPPLAAQVWPRTRPLPQLLSLSFSCPSTLFLFSQMRMCVPLTLSPSIYLSSSLFQKTSRSLQKYTFVNY
jgi:hypothetical protein